MPISKYAQLLTGLGFESEDSPTYYGVRDVVQQIFAGRQLLLGHFPEHYAAIPQMDMTMVIDEHGKIWFHETALDMSSFGLRNLLA